MKRSLKITLITIVAILSTMYLLFLFVLPNVIKLDNYKPIIQRRVNEQANLVLNFNHARLITTPLLETGIIIDDISINLPDGSNFLSADKIKTKLSLPNLLLLCVRISEINIDNPKINIDIASDGSQYKIMQIVENLINEQKQKQELVPQKPNLLTKLIRIKVPNIKVNNYSLFVNDTKSKHYLKLRGDNLKAGLNNMKTFKIKTFVEFLSDDKKMITANLDLNSFIPPATQLDKEDDPDYRADMSFVNPVLLYRDYALKTDIDAKIKARQSLSGKVKLKGHFNVDNLTMNLSGYQLPKSYFRARLKKQTAFINSNLYVAEGQNLLLTGLVNYSKRPKTDLTVLSKKIYFADLIKLTKAFMDTLHIKNDLAVLQTKGYLNANFNVKTNFKKIKSNGALIVRDGEFSNKNLDLLLNNINANVIFDNRTVKIVDTHMYINNALFEATGEINDKSVANISLMAEKLPLPALFATFAPLDLKKAYDIKSGDVHLNLTLLGKLKDAVANMNFNVSNLDLSTQAGDIRVVNDTLETKFTGSAKNISGLVLNNGLKIYLPQTLSQISVPELKINLDSRDVVINPLNLNLNENTQIAIKGNLLDYPNRAIVQLDMNGDLYAKDLKQLLGNVAEPFLVAKGKMPFKFELNGNKKRQNLLCQILSDKDNYITPVDIKNIKDLQTLLQAKITFKGDRLNIKDTGLYLQKYNFETNETETEEIAIVSGTITKLNTPNPFINQINIIIPTDLQMSICAFKDSIMSFGGKLLVFGQGVSPKYRGEFSLWDLSIPELYTTLKTLHLEFIAKNLYIKAEELLLNGSDVEIASNTSVEPASVITVHNLEVNSEEFDVPKVLKIAEVASKYAPVSEKSSNAQVDIPVAIKNGTINFANISSPPVTLQKTTGKIGLKDNLFVLDNLSTYTLDGKVTGSINANLSNMLLGVKLKGRDINVEKAFLELMNMKDTLSGTAEFSTDLIVNAGATTVEEQMKGISGTVDFKLTKGQLGPFGKLENLILAKNIRESQFFQTALGGVINSLTSIQTSHFDWLNGHIIMSNGDVELNPITSVGPVMCMNITGGMNLLSNEADMRLRARLGSKIADMLGPIAAVNPINLVKATPGLNVAAAKMFSFFSEGITEKEMNEIPQFKDDFSDISTTNFQVILKGNVQKPLSLIDSFKWLATVEDYQMAENFITTLPPVDEANPNATLEELLAMQAEAERIANENIFQKGIRKIKAFFKNDKK